MRIANLGCIGQFKVIRTSEIRAARKLVRNIAAVVFTIANTRFRYAFCVLAFEFVNLANYRMYRRDWFKECDYFTAIIRR